MDQEATMYKYPIPPGKQDTFFVYGFDAGIRGLVTGNTYQAQRISITNGDFVARAWNGAPTILNSATGQIQIYGRGRDKWWDGPVGVFQTSLTTSQSPAVFPERTYNENDLILFDLMTTLIRSNGGVTSSQLCFYGVRRRNGDTEHSDPTAAMRPYSEEVFDIPYSFTLSSLYNTAAPNILAQPKTQQKISIRDFDFELRQICMVAETADGAAYDFGLLSASPVAIWLYDSNLIQRSNIPLLAELLCQNRVTQPLSSQVWPCPPILYPVNSFITFDVYSMLNPAINPALLPVTIKMLFRGIRRFPCL